MRHQLALRLGCTLAELDNRLDPVEFSEWRAFDAISPLDTTLRLEIALARIAFLSDRAKSNDPEDYRIDWAGGYRRELELEALPDEGLSDKALGVLEAFGGT